MLCNIKYVYIMFGIFFSLMFSFLFKICYFVFSLLYVYLIVFLVERSILLNIIFLLFLGLEYFFI